MSLLRSASMLLIPDQTGQRAIEETLADWRDGQETAGNIGQRILADAQGVASLIRVLVMVTTAQLGHRHVWGPFAWAVVVAASVGAAFAFPVLLRARIPASLGDIAMLAILIMPAAVCVLFPIAAAIGLGLNRHRPTPLAGQVALAAVLSVMLTGWIVPAANHAYMRRVFEILDPSGGPRRLVRGQADFSLPALVVDLASDRPAAASGAAKQLRVRAALTLGAPTFLILGFAIRRRWMRRGSWRAAQAAALVAALGAIGCGVVLANVIAASGSYLERLDWLYGGAGARLWLTLVVAWILTALALRTRRTEH